MDDYPQSRLRYSLEDLLLSMSLVAAGWAIVYLVLIRSADVWTIKELVERAADDRHTQQPRPQ